VKRAMGQGETDESQEKKGIIGESGLTNFTISSFPFSSFGDVLP